MTTHGTAARFYYGHMDFSGYAEQVEQQLSRSLAEYRPLNGSGVIRLPGHRDARLTLTGGALDVDVGANDEYVWTRLNEETERAWAFMPYGDAHGRFCYCGQAIGENQQRVAGDDIIRLPVAVVSTRDIDRCVVLRALASGGASPGATFNSTLAGGTPDGGAAYVVCTALSAGATLTVTFEHSTDGATWVTLTTMDALDDVGSAQKVVSGAVRQYLRVSWTLAGTSPAATWFAAFGRR